MTDSDVFPTPRHCPDCGSPLALSRLDGLCPVCLLEETPSPDFCDHTSESGPGLMHLPGYRLTREIARGGMGIIYEAIQQNPARTVAIKMLLPHLMEEPAMRERFRREAQSMAALDHPGILPVYEVGDYNGLPYFTMKLAPGGTLTAQAPRFRGKWRSIASLIAALGDAIQTAHTHGVLHRDLKPSNILFDEQQRAYVSDFGIAKQLAQDPADLDLTKTSSLLGTPNYLPPEWAGGTARSATTAGDLYGLGAVFYQLLTGDPPHRAAQLTTLLRQIADDPVTPPRQINRAIPRDLEIICLKALAKDPVHRYQTASALSEDLRLWLDGRPIKARAASPVEKLWRWSRRNPLPASLAASLLLALTFGGAALWHSLQTSRENLHNSLVAQASALRETGRLGNRTRSIAALEQAIALQPSAAARTELSSALAMADLREVQRFSYGSGQRVYTDAALTRYSYVDSKGHITVHRVSDHTVLSSVPGDLLDPEGYGPFSPDGRFLALRPVKGQPFSIWDCEAQTFRLRDLVGSFVLFGPDSRTLAVGTSEGVVKLMDLTTGVVLRELHTGLKQVRPYSFSPDGSRLVVGQFKTSKFAVVETATGQVIMEKEHPPAARVRCAVWRPDGSGFFIGTESFKIYEWSLTANSLPRQYTGHHGNVFALAIHPTGEWLLSQSQDGTTRLWNTASATSVAELPYYGAEVRFSPDGRRLLCEDREARLLHLVDLIPSAVCRQFSVPHPDTDRVGTRGCWFLTFSPDGGLLSVGDTDGLIHFDGITGALLGTVTSGYCWSLAWASDGSRLYSVSKDGLQSWPVIAPCPPQPVPLRSTLPLPWLPGPVPHPLFFSAAPVIPPSAHCRQRTFLPAEVWALDHPVPPLLGPGMNHVAVSGDNLTVAMAFDRNIGLYNAASGQLSALLPRTPNLLDALALNHDGSLAAASRQDAPGVPVWDTARRLRIALLPTKFVEANVCFHPDGRRIFTGDLQELTCWDARSGSILWRVPCPARTSSAVEIALTPDGSLLAANLSEGTITIFHALTGEEITHLRHPNAHTIACLAFSPNQSRLAVLCLGHLVQLWDLRALRAELSTRALDWPSKPLPPPLTPHKWTIVSRP